MAHAKLPTDLSPAALAGLQQFDAAGIAQGVDRDAAEELIAAGCALRGGEPAELELTNAGRELRLMLQQRRQVP